VICRFEERLHKLEPLLVHPGVAHVEIELIQDDDTAVGVGAFQFAQLARAGVLAPKIPEIAKVPRIQAPQFS